LILSATAPETIVAAVASSIVFHICIFCDSFWWFSYLFDSSFLVENERFIVWKKDLRFWFIKKRNHF